MYRRASSRCWSSERARRQRTCPVLARSSRGLDVCPFATRGRAQQSRSRPRPVVRDRRARARHPRAPHGTGRVPRRGAPRSRVRRRRSRHGSLPLRSPCSGAFYRPRRRAELERLLASVPWLTGLSVVPASGIARRATAELYDDAVDGPRASRDRAARRAQRGAPRQTALRWGRVWRASAQTSLPRHPCADSLCSGQRVD